MKKFKLYIVDFDGTIINSFEGLKVFYRAIFGEIGHTVSDEECYLFTKMSLQAAFEYKTHSSDPELIKRFRNKCDEVVATGELLKHNVPFSDTIPFVNYIKEHNIKCGIVTGNVKTHVDMVLDNLGLNDFASFMITSYDLKKQKPDPEGILLSLEMANYKGDKKDVCYVGDAYNDFLAAKAAGVTPVMIDRHNEYKESDEYIVIKDLMELFED